MTLGKHSRVIFRLPKVCPGIFFPDSDSLRKGWAEITTRRSQLRLQEDVSSSTASVPTELGKVPAAAEAPSGNSGNVGIREVLPGWIIEGLEQCLEGHGFQLPLGPLESTFRGTGGEGPEGSRGGPKGPGGGPNERGRS